MIKKSLRRVLLAGTVGIVAVSGISIGLSEPAQALTCKVARALAIPPSCPNGKAICAKWEPCTRTLGRTGSACMGYSCLDLNKQGPFKGRKPG
jgi:hypothetical protein